MDNILTTMPNKHLFNIKRIKRAAPSLNSILCKTKQPSLGLKHGTSAKCNVHRCRTCQLMSNTDSVTLQVGNRKLTIQTGAGDCSCRNVIYLVLCKCCRKYYVGKTTQPLHCRFNQHRWCFENFVKKHGQVTLKTEKDKDKYALGMHLYNDHNFTNEHQFNNAFTVHILEVTQPRIIDVREHMWIHKLKTLDPVGINVACTFGIPLIS